MSGVETELGQTDDDDDATDLTAEAETDWLDTYTMEFLPGIMRRLAFPTAACLGSLDGDALRDVTMEEFIHSGNMPAVRYYQFLVFVSYE